MNTRRVITLILLLLAPLVPVVAWGFEELTDQKLNAITAGSSDAALGSVDALTRIPFKYDGNKGSVDGEVIVVPMANYINQGSLQLMDNAQSNLRSLINVNAVNSPVQILLNLTVNVKSTIGNITQLNNLLSSQGSWR